MSARRTSLRQYCLRQHVNNTVRRRLVTFHPFNKTKLLYSDFFPKNLLFGYKNQIIFCKKVAIFYLLMNGCQNIAYFQKNNYSDQTRNSEVSPDRDAYDQAPIKYVPGYDQEGLTFLIDMIKDVKQHYNLLNTQAYEMCI